MPFRSFKRVPHHTIGLFGLERHGKTTLATAIFQLFGITEPANPEGTTAEIYHAREPMQITTREFACMIDGVPYAMIDFGTDFDGLKSMILGGFELECIILVVSAATGPLPSEWDILRLAWLIKVWNFVVFISKTDEVNDPESLELLEAEAREMLCLHGFYGNEIPFVRGSALSVLVDGLRSVDDPTVMCIRQLLKVVSAAIRPPIMLNSLPFLMPVEGIFDIEGRGTVAVGDIERGLITLRDNVDLVGMRPGLRRVVIAGLEAFRKTLDHAQAGDRVGCLLEGVERDQLRPGQVLAAPGSIGAHAECRAWVYLNARHEGGIRVPIFSGHSCPLYFWVANVAGTLILLNGQEMALPGDLVELKVLLSLPLALELGLRFALREAGRVIGFGIVTGLE